MSFTTIIEILQKFCVNETTMINNLKKQKYVLFGSHDENQIRALGYSAENSKTKIGRQTRKRETNTNMDQRSKRLDWLETIRPDRESRHKVDTELP